MTLAQKRSGDDPVFSMFLCCTNAKVHGNMQFSLKAAPFWVRNSSFPETSLVERKKGNAPLGKCVVRPIHLTQFKVFRGLSRVYPVQVTVFTPKLSF